LTGSRPTILFHDIFLKHDTGSSHPESAERLIAIRNHLVQAGLWRDEEIVAPRAASQEELSSVHHEEYVQWVKSVSESETGTGDPDTPVSKYSYEAACHAAGAGIVAADLMMDGTTKTAFCCVRPPGHHADEASASGFCLFNNVAVAVRHLQHKYGLNRIAVIDWDVHHGNGTQNIFFDDPGVFYFSMHRYPFFPGTGRTSETGTGKAAGTTLNIPLPHDTSSGEYLLRYERAIRRIADEFAPEVVVVSAGFDGYHADSLAGLCLRPEDYGNMTKHLVEQTSKSANGRVLSMLEGGYQPTALAICVEQHLLHLGA